MFDTKSIEVKVLANFNISIEEYHKTLSKFLDENGKIIVDPTKRKNKVILCCYLASLFKPDTPYREGEVNDIINQITPDFVKYRRALIDYTLLMRTTDGSLYRKGT